MKSIEELEEELRQKVDECYKLRREIDKRKGETVKPVEVNFEDYVTK